MEQVSAKADDVVLSVKDLTVGFGERLILDKLSLDVRRGEILGFVGPSGAGKSVQMRTIIGQMPKRAGRIEVDPLPVTGGLGEEVDALLVDGDPVAHAKFLAHQGLQVGDLLEGLRHGWLIQSMRGAHWSTSRWTRPGATSHRVRPRAAR